MDGFERLRLEVDLTLRPGAHRGRDRLLAATTDQLGFAAEAAASEDAKATLLLGKVDSLIGGGGRKV
jgi:hypothetical protein